MIDPKMIQALAERSKADSVDMVMQCMLSLMRRFELDDRLRKAIVDEMCRLLLTTTNRTFEAVQEVFDEMERSK